MKTKLGLSNCIVAAMFYFLAFLSIYYSSGVFAIPALVLAAYVLYKEEDLWLKASVIKGIFLALFIGLLQVTVGFANDVMDFINFFLKMADAVPVYDEFGIIAEIKNLIHVAGKIFFISLSLVALKGKTVKLPVIDKMISKHIQ